MAVNPTYPGVYIEEVPSGVRTITGVATSITAFLGRTPRGEPNEPVLITSFADFERMYGGLHVDYPLSYAVSDFYRNGGSQALIVRLYKVADGGNGDGNGKTGNGNGNGNGNTGTNGEATIKIGELALEAANPGRWSNKLSAKVDHDGLDVDGDGNGNGNGDGNGNGNGNGDGDGNGNGNGESIPEEEQRILDDLFSRYGLPDDAGLRLSHFFNLTVVENPPDGPREVFRNVSLHPDAGPRRVDRVLEEESSLVRVSSDLPKADVAGRPTETGKNEDPTNRKANNIQYFENGKDSANLTKEDFIGLSDEKSGMYALNKADLFNLLCIPPDTRGGDVSNDVYQEAMQYCTDRRAMLIVDSPAAWGKNKQTPAKEAKDGLPALGLNGPAARNAALYFPRVVQTDPRREGQLDTFVPCGIIAGVMARTDAQRGVWKAPAGLDASVNGIQGLEVNLSDEENGQLNPLGINCLRFFPAAGRVVWGARTLRGNDQLADEYKYVPVRRLALFIEESLYRGTQWVVFEPNDEPLWAQIRLNVGAFMHNLFRQGAFQGSTPREAYLVKCDSETTTQNDINLGIVNILVGFAPLKPAEFVIIKIQQLAGQVVA
jgi:uncharacterized protein